MRRFTIASVVLLACAIAAGLFFAYDRPTGEASQLSPLPSFHVDIGDSADPASTGNSYVEDPNGDTDASDQLMSVAMPLTPCVRRDVSDFGNTGQVRVVTDIIIKDAQEMVGGDVRLNFDPSLIQVFTADITPFTAASDFLTGFTGQRVGLINLPVEPFSGGAHRTAISGSNIDNTNGAVFLGGTYLGSRAFDVSSESGPSVDSATNSLPNRNAGQAPDGGVFVRINWNLQPASDGQDVLIDLTTLGVSFTGGGVITAGSQFVSLLIESPTPLGTPEIVILGNADLFDGVVSVNKAVPSPCPPGAPAPAPTATPVPGTIPTATATAMPTGDGGLPDADRDGVPDVEDKCPGTATGASVDASGCFEAQLEELKKEAKEELLEELTAGMNLTVALDAVTAGGSTDVLAVCADENDNPLPAVDVTFNIDKQPGSGANLDGQAEVTKASDAEGVAEAKLNVGSTPGDIVVSATAEECETETITVTVTRTSTPTGDGVTPTSARTPASTPTGEAGGLIDPGDIDGDAGGSGSNWVLYVLVPSLLLAVLGGSALLWLMRRRIAWPRSWPLRRK